MTFSQLIWMHLQRHKQEDLYTLMDIVSSSSFRTKKTFRIHLNKDTEGRATFYQQR